MRTLLLAALVLDVFAPRVVRADAGDYCTGPGYIAYWLGGGSPRAAPPTLFVIALGPPGGIGATATVALPDFQAQGMMCRDSTIGVASHDLVFMAHLDAARHPVRSETLLLPMPGMTLTEYTRVGHLGGGSNAVRTLSTERVLVMKLPNAHAVWLEIVPHDFDPKSCRVAITSRLIERDAARAEIRVRVLHEATTSRFTEYSCPPAAPLHPDAARVQDSVNAALLSPIERVHGRDSPLTAIALCDSARAYIREGKLDLGRRAVDRALAIIVGRADIHVATQAYALRTQGVVMTAGRWDENSVRVLTAALRLLQRQVPPDHAAIDQTQYELADAYRSTGKLEDAAAHIDSLTRDSVLRALPPRARVERLALLAELRLTHRDFAAVHQIATEADGIAAAASLPDAVMEPLLWRSAEAYVRVGAAASAESVYQRQLRVQRGKPTYSDWIPELIRIIGGLAIDQGYYRRADSLYRAAFREVALHKAQRPRGLCRDWAALMSDLDREQEAQALLRLHCDDLLQPQAPAALVAASLPTRAPVPDRVDVRGVSPNQIARRLEWPYAGDLTREPLTTLWSDLGLPPWSISCGACSVKRIDLPGSPGSTVLRLYSNRTDVNVRFLLVEPTGHTSAGVREWAVSGYRDGWMESFGAVPRMVTGGTERWLAFTSSVTEDDGGDGPNDPTYEFHRETWFDLRERVFRSTLSIPLGGYETAYQLSSRLSGGGEAHPSAPAGPGRRTTVEVLPLRMENAEPVIELQLAVTFRAGTGYGRATERDLFTLNHHMTFIRRSGAIEFTVDSTRSDLSFTDMGLLYDIPSAALGYGDVLRLTFPQLEAIARGSDVQNKDWLRRLTTIAPESDQKQALLALLGRNLSSGG